MAASIMSTVSQNDPEICHKAARYAVRVSEEMSKRSGLINDVEDVVPHFDRDEIIPYLGDLLGKGGFNLVYELKRIELLSQSSNSSIEKLRNRLAFSKEKFAVKFLCEEAMNNADEFCNGAADLLMEAKYLSALAKHPHPGLIQLYGVASEGASGFKSGLKGGYFLIIDRLYDTLDRRIDVWREVKRRRSKDTTSTTNRKLLKALYFQRIMVAYDIALALKHLHKLEIIFRDLKPDNIGFDIRGVVKLFDFGLAKELDPYQKLDSGLYKMSGGTGSRRFMAPEVSLSEPYNLSADIYSFSVLLWELLSLEKAFGDLSSDDHKEQVIKGDQRLPFDKDWPLPVTVLLTACWDPDPFKRPSARDTCKALRQELSMCYDSLRSKTSGSQERRPSY